MKETEKQRVRDIYILSPNELSYNKIHKILKTEGLYYSVPSIKALIDREHLKEKRQKRVPHDLNVRYVHVFAVIGRRNRDEVSAVQRINSEMLLLVNAAVVDCLCRHNFPC